MRGRAEAHRHLLHHAGHEEGEHHEGDEETDAKSGACRGIREHAGAVILTEHDKNAGADEQPEQPEAGTESAACARR